MRRWLPLIAVVFSAGWAHAAATPWQTNPHGRVRLLSAENTAPASGEILLALQFQPTVGWYTYWKDPGEAGIPPRITWTGTTGLKGQELLFPQPTRILLPGDITEFGYEGEVVYPIRASVTGGPVNIKAKLTYLTCDTSCVPYTYTFTLDIPSGAAAVDADAQTLIQTALARVPAKGISDAQIKNQAPIEHKTPGEAPAKQIPVALLTMLLIAFIGGVLLNVMPCVLPVLSIKLTGLLQHSGSSRTRVAQSALASAAGILVSFLGLALVAVTARQAGHAVGWGIQFQNSGFVTFLLVVVLLFALNLWGVFEIQMPRWAGSLAVSRDGEETLVSHFVSGLFATLLATPCSAPFLGTAMGFALSQPAVIIFSVFALVGAGLALPYILLAIFPQTVSWLPRPGDWMITLKKGMALLLVATAVWLGWVLKQQYMYRRSAVSVSPGDYSWKPFKESDIDQFLNEGKPVLVDVTAAWCVTCKYNERFVLRDSEIVAELDRQHVVLMRADWTNRNEAIGAYLTKYGRAGIPFYAFYRPGKPPVLLSEFLTKAKVLDALRSN